MQITLIDTTYIFVAVLIYCQVYRTERASSDLLLNNILVDTMFGNSIILTCYIF